MLKNPIIVFTGIITASCMGVICAGLGYFLGINTIQTYSTPQYMCIDSVKHYNAATPGSTPRYKPLYDKDNSPVSCTGDTFCNNGFLFGYNTYGEPTQLLDTDSICKKPKE